MASPTNLRSSMPLTRISTDLPAPELLNQLQSVEETLGKVVRKNGPRLIDLDLLVYDELELETKDLVLPHPGIMERDFVLLPLIDLNPDLSHPQWGTKTLKSALRTSGKVRQGFPRRLGFQIGSIPAVKLITI